MVHFAPLVLSAVLVPQAGLPAGVEAALVAWRSGHGEGWQVVLDEETRRVRLLMNGCADEDFEPRDERERFLLSRALLMDAHGLFGLDDDTLVADRARFLPLGMVGISDKRTLRFRQEVAGVPVIGGRVNLLFDAQDGLLSVDSRALPDLSGFDVEPGVQPEAARATAKEAFLALSGVPPELVGEPRLAIRQRVQRGRRSPQLVWEIELAARDAMGEPHAHRVLVAAEGRARVVDTESLVHRAAQQAQRRRGRVEALVVVHPEWRPDPRDGTFLEARPMAYTHVKDTTGKILATTDRNGEFSVPAGVGPTTVRIDFHGLYADVCNAPPPPNFSICSGCAHNFRKVVTLDRAYTPILMKAGYDEEVVAQANLVHHIGAAADWIRSVDPLDGTFDREAPIRARPNRPVCSGAALSTCLDMGIGSPILWFSRHVGSNPDACENLAYSTIIWHELGHALNAFYGNGNHKGSGFGEGAADVWAMYLADYPWVGNGTPQRRTGANEKLFCGDCDRGFPPPKDCTDCQGCNGTSHSNGEVLMGALWKVREELKLFLGDDDLGGDTADALFLAWMKAFDTERITSLIEYQWLLLDVGPDGLLDNAPHLAPIDAGFHRQGFPGYTMPPVRYVCDP